MHEFAQWMIIYTMLQVKARYGAGWKACYESYTRITMLDPSSELGYLSALLKQRVDVMHVLDKCQLSSWTCNFPHLSSLLLTYLSSTHSMSIQVGDRIQVGSDLTTVRFHGQVEGTKGEWLAIE